MTQTVLEQSTPIGRVAPRLVVHVVEATEAGVARHVIDVIEGTLDSGSWRCALIYSPVRASPRFRAGVDRLVSKGVPVVPVPMHRALSPAGDLRAFIRVRRALVQLGDVAIVHTHSAKAGFLGRLAAKVTRTPAVHTPNGVPWKATSRPAVQVVYRSLERLASRWSDVTVAVSAEERRELISAGVVTDAHCRVAENAIPDTPLAAVGALREKLQIERDEPLVVTVGRVDYQKDPDLFLAVADVLLTRHPRVHCIWIGDGPALERVRARAAALGPRVRFVGSIPDVETLLVDADVYLSTSRYEGLSYAVLEAMRAGRPIVAPAIEGTTSVIGGGGIIVPSRTPADFADAIIRTLSEAGSMHIGRAARERFLSRYQLKNLVAQLESVYSEVVSPRR